MVDPEKASLLRDRIYAVRPFWAKMAEELEANGEKKDREKLRAIHRLNRLLYDREDRYDDFSQLEPACQETLLEAERRAGPDYLARWERQLFPPQARIGETQEEDQGRSVGVDESAAGSPPSTSIAKKSTA